MTRRPPPSRKSPPGQRPLRVAEQIRHALAEVLQRGHFHDPLLMAESAAITVTAVDIGPDLKHAQAYVMPLGGKNRNDLLRALNDANGFFRSQIASKLDLRYAPKITFRLDDSFDQAEKIETLLRQPRVRKDLVGDSDDED